MKLADEVNIEAKKILGELNPNVCAETVKNLLLCPQQARGLAKLLMCFSAVEFMAKAKRVEKKDPFLDAACDVLAMEITLQKRIKAIKEGLDK